MSGQCGSITQPTTPIANLIVQGDNNVYVSTIANANSGSASIHVHNNETSASLSPYSLRVNGTTYDSKESLKKNIKLCDKKALNIIQYSEVYEYLYKYEKDNSKKHIGFVIPDKNGPYRVADEILSAEKDGIDVYSTLGIMWKAIQEQQQQIEELQNEIKLLKGEKYGEN